ncbi:hypothetical protein B7463_g3726, partial [Scytalidium lignicola]
MLPKRANKRAETSDSSSSRGENVNTSLTIESAGPSTLSKKRKAEEEIIGSLDPSASSQSQNVKGQEGAELIAVLNDNQLIFETMKLAFDKEPELTLLKLMGKYNFSFEKMKDLLKRENMNLNFSRVKYKQISSRVGLLPQKDVDGIQTFEMHYARLLKETFVKIIDDIDLLGKQYGTTEKQNNEEARARYLSAYFNQIVGMFGGVIFNTPESIIEGKITTKGRIEYQFKMYGGITIVFIEVKQKSGTNFELLDFIAQVIAECDACAWVNHQDGRYIGDPSPQFFIGNFQGGSKRIRIEDPPSSFDSDYDCRNHVLLIRRSCEALYYMFLKSYIAGLDANWNRSTQTGEREDKERDSTPGWLNARSKGEAALNTAIQGSEEYFRGELANSEGSAKLAADFLEEH